MAGATPIKWKDLYAGLRVEVVTDKGTIQGMVVGLDKIRPRATVRRTGGGGSVVVSAHQVISLKRLEPIKPGHGRVGLVFGE